MCTWQREQAAVREVESYHQVEMVRQKWKGRVGKTARTGDEGVRTEGSRARECRSKLAPGMRDSSKT